MNQTPEIQEARAEERGRKVKRKILFELKIKMVDGHQVATANVAHYNEPDSVKRDVVRQVLKGAIAAAHAVGLTLATALDEGQKKELMELLK